MKEPYKEAAAILASAGIRPSYQRIRIYDYLISNRCHPTADVIFCSLHEQLPTLSKSTVYNTLNSFIQAGLVRVLTIEDIETRYDISVENHGHFKCESCGAIYDFDIDLDGFSTEKLDGFRIDDKNVYFKGVCPECLASNNNIK